MKEKDEYIIKLTEEERNEILAGLQNNQKDYFRVANVHMVMGKLAINTDARHKIERAEKTMEF